MMVRDGAVGAGSGGRVPSSVREAAREANEANEAASAQASEASQSSTGTSPSPKTSVRP